MNVFLKTFFVLLAAAAVLGFAYLLTFFGPRGVYDPNLSASKLTTDEAYTLVLQAAELEADFLERIKLGAPTSTDMANLEKAINYLTEYLNTSASVDKHFYDKRKNLLAIKHDILGKDHFDNLKRLMILADDAFTSGNYDKALELYKEIDEGWTNAAKLYPESKYYDINTIAKAKKMLEVVSVVPINNELKQTQKNAENAVAEKRWKDAESLYNKAIELQTKINQQFGSTIYSNYTKINELQIELDSLKTAPLESEIAENIERGNDAEEKGDYNTAAEFYKVAYDKQRLININFARSRVASKENLDKIMTMIETALSRQLYESIDAQKAELNKLLRAGGTSSEIPSVCEDLLLKCERFKKEFSKSTILDDELILSLRYLGFLGKNIPAINKEIRDNLIPISAESDTKMLKKEISQHLYRLVMQENPSRSQDDQKPVETISYMNALDFCRRLSWITAQEISLPKASEFREAIGSLKYVDLNAIAWHAGNSSLQTQRVASKAPNIRGFYDLLGNVAEYTMAEDSFSKPGIIGGSAQTWTDSLSEIPFYEIDPSVRGDRMVGFRIVIRE